MKSIFTLSILFVTQILFAHNGTIKGIVTDADSKSELSAAIVRLEPSGATTISNEVGGFVFADLEAGDYTISVSYIGFETQSQTVRVVDHETAVVRFSMKMAALDLAVVEVNGAKNKPLSTLSALDIQMKPINSAQDILRFVPGLIIAQHAGGGKAEQIFLRGFDIDHGTDIALTVDDMPVNIVSHAHGQGYADLHWVIPELISKVDFQKGCYDPTVGNLGTAGAVKFKTDDALTKSFVKIEAGQFQTARGVGAFDLLGDKARARGQSAYLASEYLFSNSFFDSPQDFHRANLMGKYKANFDDKKFLTLSFSTFSSKWNASGQIPERLVKSGQLSRFGSIDPSEGGRTARTNLNAELITALTDHSYFKNQIFWSRYDFELYSNFTFFLEDRVNGDEIRQKEGRNIFGYHSTWHSQTQLFEKNLTLEAGIKIRYDQTQNSELSHVTKRVQLNSRLALGNIDEVNAAAFASATWDFAEKWSLNAGLRFDQFNFGYQNLLDTTTGFTKSVAKNIASPKATLNWAASKKLNFYLAAGTGFHSNDTRVVVPQNGLTILPRSIGFDAGFFAKPYEKLLIGAAFWQLGLEQEFVYVGDAAVVEPGGRTLRRGLDLSARWQLLPTVFFDADYAYSHGRSIDDPDGQNLIPLAPVHVGQGGLTWETKSGFSAGLRSRYIADRPANADNSLVAEGYFILDGTLRFSKKSWEIGLTAQNLTNAEWKEAQFATETQLKTEAAPVTEIHFTPGTPFFLKGSLTVFF